VLPSPGVAKKRIVAVSDITEACTCVIERVVAYGRVVCSGGEAEKAHPLPRGILVRIAPSGGGSTAKLVRTGQVGNQDQSGIFS